MECEMEAQKNKPCVKLPKNEFLVTDVSKPTSYLTVTIRTPVDQSQGNTTLWEQDRRYKYNPTRRYVRATIVVVVKLQVLHIISVCL
jgi:hypothetical protein